MKLKILVILFILQISDVVFSERVSVLSYNVWQLPKIAFSAHRPRKRSVAIAQYLRNNPRDIVGLQEAFTRKAYKEISREMKELNYYSSDQPKAKALKGKILNSGLVLFTKFPIIKTTFKEFEGCHGFDCAANKGVLAALLQLDEKNSIYVVNIHLQSGTKPKEIKERKKQILELKEFIEGPFFSEEVPVILLGDFNTNKGSDSYNYLIEKLNLSDRKLLGEEKFSYNTETNKLLTKNEKIEQELLDYIFLYNNRYYGGDGTREVIKPRGDYLRFNNIDLSDHFAIEAILDL